MLCSCNNNLPGRGKRVKHTITIAGSTSVMPFVEKLAEHYMVDNPDFAINVQGGGSTAGIQACALKTVDIGMSSRQLNEDEKFLKELVFCHDGISIVVNPKNTVNGLSLKQTADIFARHIKTWDELGWAKRGIDAVTREAGSGTRGSFEELVMKGVEIDDSILVEDSNGSVREVVATDPYAIGYVSMGLVDNRVKALLIDGVLPTKENIQVKKYRIVRPFIFVINGEPSEHVQKFLTYVLSREGQNLLKKEGLITTND